MRLRLSAVVVLRCPSCFCRLYARPEWEGKRIRCTRCRHGFVLGGGHHTHLTVEGAAPSRN